MEAREVGWEGGVGGEEGIDVLVALFGCQEVGFVEGAVEALGELDAPELCGMWVWCGV